MATKGKKLSLEHKQNIGKSIKKLGIKPPIMIGKKNPKWKGDKVSYRNLHRWVERILGKPRFCENCGNKSLNHRQYHWSNISKKYKRIISDWQRLCAKCHKLFDKKQ